MLNLKFIKEKLNTPIYGEYSENTILDNICIDTRKIIINDVFVAITGNKYNPNNDIIEILNKNISGLIINKNFLYLYLENNSFHKKTWCIAVEDTKQFLWNLAIEWRKQFNIPIVAITGSVGKTTTKDILGDLLKISNKNALITKDSQNGFIGLPLTILKLRKEHEIGIFEIGISAINEMNCFGSLLSPSIVIFTHIGIAHLLGFNSCEKIYLKEKLSLINFLEKDKIIILNENIQLEKEFKNIIKFGKNINNDIIGDIIEEKNNKLIVKFIIFNKEFIISLPILHEGFFYNVLAALSLLKALNIEINQEIINKIENFKTVKGRFSIFKIKNKNSIIINDCYNANPDSMKESLNTFLKIKTNLNKVIFLGDMRELGKNSIHFHEEILNTLNNFEKSKIILIGNEFKNACKNLNLNIKTFNIQEEAKNNLNDFLKNDNSIVFLKGSNLINLSNLITDYSLEQISSL